MPIAAIGTSKVLAKAKFSANYSLLAEGIFARSAGAMMLPRTTARIPATSLPTIIGKIMSGLLPAQKPRWSPNTNAAETANAQLRSLPFGFISLRRLNIAMLLARFATIPAEPAAFMPRAEPTFSRALPKWSVTNLTIG